MSRKRLVDTKFSSLCVDVTSLRKVANFIPPCVICLPACLSASQPNEITRG